MDTEILDVLWSIDASLKQLVSQTRTTAVKEIAPASDLDGQYGDPEVKAKDPRDWTGPTQKGKRFSQCSSEYLELVASRLDWFAEQAEKEGKTTSSGKPLAPYNRRDAARARGWAKRIRDGYVPQNNGGAAWVDSVVNAQQQDPAAWAEPLTDDDIPF